MYATHSKLAMQPRRTVLPPSRTMRPGASDWVPRRTYDMLMEKLDAATLENQKLAAENRRLLKVETLYDKVAGPDYSKGLPLGARRMG